ncbi:nitro flavin reductase [Lapidilactobacillus concavus DSM 17758]|uniref:Nitro flavin reductase n=1 Tax=Lapidilactobacillus concavus DSM 17758 TaxID=1423735 RepID=A0A0R1VQL5_9LACO|nr:NADPH-dependent oxidoreductase [Lapidilactobacillus concavus]KRM08080.1 nitro flavin reductase [Lapidilactobacillus concavus DSM 17758]GEL12960.1 NADPH-dependent oxidoreductase [Lapidilactobacillus concavus]
MNSAIEHQLHHRTIRAFTAQEIPATTIDTLIDVARHTATSEFLQAFSVISVTDPQLKKAIAAISKQTYVGDNGHLFIFVADQHRNAQIGHEMGQDENKVGGTNKFLAAASDAILALQNTVVAAESMGLGTVVLGSILNDAGQLIDLLHLPQLTFPILGLAIGYPDQEPQYKPRLPKKFMHFENSYQLSTPLIPQLKAYDAEVHEYYDLREANRRVDTFTNQVNRSLLNVPEKRHELLQLLHQQGFLLE